MLALDPTRRALTRVIPEEPAFAALFIAYLLARNPCVEADLIDKLFKWSEKRIALGTKFDRPIATVFLNRRISRRPRRYDSPDSAPLFSLARSGWSPSKQLPVWGSISAVCNSFSPKNQPNARIAPAAHSPSSSAFNAA